MVRTFPKNAVMDRGRANVKLNIFSSVPKFVGQKNYGDVVWFSFSVELVII